MSLTKLSPHLFLAMMLSATTLLAPARPAAGAAPMDCSNPYLVDVTFTNGARWRMCWEERNNEGIVFRDIYYTPVGGTERYVLYQANLATLHVPYDDNSARYFDLSDYGLGGGYMIELLPGDCPGGTLLANNGRNVLCQQMEARGYAYKYGTAEVQGQKLTLFSVSEIGQYNYIPQWTFNDDGSIEPAIGATGRLQQFTIDRRYGWLLSGTNHYGTNHAHNVWWRLDFDLVDPGNDQVDEIEFQNPTASQRPMTMTPLTTESSRQFSPVKFRFWRVKDTVVTNADGHPISYEIDPVSNNVFRGPSYEPWTQSDFYVTQYHSCEIWVAHNPTSGGCGANVTDFINGEPVNDVVVWTGISFHHAPRDEDEPNMLVHWNGFDIMPRDWTATDPIP